LIASELTLSQVFVPFGSRTTGMMKALFGPGACCEEEQVHWGSDRLCVEGGRAGHKRWRGLSQDGHQRWTFYVCG